jgi:hypothetical protein
LLPEAVSIVFDSLCDGAKNAVLIQLKHRYALTLDSPGITVEKLSVAIIDIFGIDGGQMLTEKIWLTIEEMIASEALRKRRSHIIQSGRNDK